MSQVLRANLSKNAREERRSSPEEKVLSFALYYFRGNGQDIFVSFGGDFFCKGLRALVAFSTQNQRGYRFKYPV